MAIDTKPNFSNNKFEQCVGDIMNLSGCTQIYGYLDIESGATITICDNAGIGKVLTSDATGIASWQSISAGQGITAISGGSGMNFSPITTTGNIVLGTPSTITTGGTNIVSGTTHNHFFDASTFVSGTQGILVDGQNRFYLDEIYITDATRPNLYTFTGVSSNQSLGVLPSGQTLGMIYITNVGSSIAYVNFGTTPTGDDITPYQTIQLEPNDDVSVTINMRLSLTENETIYINSPDWTNVELNVQWANITYQNASTTINPGDLPIASQTTLGAIKVGSGLDIDNEGILSVTGGTGGGTVTGAGNGLTLDGTTIVLGGILTGNTVICSTGTNYFNVNGSDGSTDGIWFKDNDSAYIGKSTNTGNCNSYGSFRNSCASIVSVNSVAGNYSCLDLFGSSGCTVWAYNCDFLVNDAAQRGIQYIADYSTTFCQHSLVDKNYVDICVSAATSGGSGGFLGTVSQASIEPLDLQENQWVKPAPTPTGVFNYTFTNFLDSGSTAINVNLSLEDVYLRYCDNGYWVKESYSKPLSSGHTWFGDVNSEASEVMVINEWVGSEAALEFPGQKYAYPTQTISVSDVLTCTVTPNYVITESIPLNLTGNTQVMAIPSGCGLVLNRAKLIFLQTANPTSFCVSIGNNDCTNRHLSYDNLVSCVQIDDVLINETYDLQLLQKGVTSSIGGTVFFRVGNSTNCNLCAHLLIEGFLY